MKKLDYQAMIDSMTRLSWKNKLIVALLLVFIGVWMLSFHSSADCSVLANSQWQLTVAGKKYRAELIINQIVPYANFPDISRILGTVKTEKASRSFNMALCFKRGGKIEIQEIPMPAGFNQSEFFSSETFAATEFTIPIILYHKSKQGVLVNDYKGMLQRQQ